MRVTCEEGWKVTVRFSGYGELEQFAAGIVPSLDPSSDQDHLSLVKASIYGSPTLGLIPDRTKRDISIGLPDPFTPGDLEGYLGRALRSPQMVKAFPQHSLTFLLEQD